MGQSRWIDDDKIWRKRTPSFLSHESIVPRNLQKQRRWKIINTLLRWWGNDRNCFSHYYFCLSAQYLRSSFWFLCDECKSCHVRTGSFVMVGQSDPLFVPTRVMKTLTLLTDDLAQEDLWQKYHERVDKLSQQNRVIKFCTDAGFLTTVDVGQYFVTKDTEEFSQFTNQWLVVSTLCQEMKNHLTRKVGFEGTPELGPYWKSQPATYKVNMEWKLELNL